MFRPVDAAGLVAFRVMFGLLMAWDTSRYVMYGWVHDHFVEPPILLKYLGFHWVEPLPESMMYAVFGVMIASGLTISLGWFYRFSCALFCLGHTYAFLLAASYYLNHGYLVSVWAFLMIFVPAHRAASVDAMRDPGLHTRTVHAWYRWLLLGTIAIVYMFGAIAKMNADWIQGVPVRQWMDHSASEVAYGQAFLRSETFTWMVVWGGMFFDLLAPFGLLWRRTRIPVAIVSTGFHLTNAYMFNIGVFPWFMIAATTLFFEPDWPRRLPLKIGKQFGDAIDHLASPGLGLRRHEERESAPEGPPEVDEREKNVTTGLVSGFLLLMCLIPLRHHLYPGTVAWTEEGHYFAWRMKLRDKRGRIEYVVTAPASGQRWVVNPNEQLHSRQVRKLTSKPDLILQYAHYLRDAYKRDYGEDVEVRVNSWVSLNYRKEQRFIDPDVDLAKEEFSLLHYDWLLPFEDTPLPSPARNLKKHLGPAADRVARTMERVEAHR